MADLFQALFGGSSNKSSASSTQQSTSTPIDMQAPEFQALRNQFASILAGLSPQSFNTLGAPVAPMAPMGSQETGAMNYINQLAMDPQRAALLSRTMAGEFLPGQAAANPFMNAAIEMAQRPTAEALQHAVGRQIPGLFAQAGHQVGQTVGGGGSTAKDLNVIRAAEIGGRTLGDIATGLSFQGYETERGRQQQAIQLQQNEVAQAIANFNAQMTPRLIEQLGIEQGRNVAKAMQDSWLQALALFGGITAPAVANQGQASGTSSGTSSGSNSGSGLFGAIFPKGLYNPSPSTMGVTA